jgi:hypothetical protein
MAEMCQELARDLVLTAFQEQGPGFLVVHRRLVELAGEGRGGPERAESQRDPAGVLQLPVERHGLGRQPVRVGVLAGVHRLPRTKG